MTQEIKIGSTVSRVETLSVADPTTHPGVFGTVKYISLSSQLEDNEPAWASVEFTTENQFISGVYNLDTLVLVDPPKSTAPTCPACDSTDLHWYVAKTRANSFPGANGPLPLNEVKVIGYLACEECSETVRTIEVEEIEEMMNLRLL